jgi:HprK-related kinase A
LYTVNLDLSPFTLSVSSDIPSVVHNLSKIYHHVFVPQSDVAIDFHLTVKKMNGLRAFFKPQAQFLCDQIEPFKPMSLNKSYALLEWGMNWTIAANEMQYVIIHSAVLAKGNKAILFPAPPGSGKSTITSYLAFNGWRLLSDEMALILPYSNKVQPFVRPICLKNNSIQLARDWFPDAVFSNVAKDTHKGDVIHLSPPKESWDNRHELAEIVGVVFPKYTAGDAPMKIYELNKNQAFTKLVDNAFNYGVVGEKGFKTFTTLLETCYTFEILHNNMAEVQAFLEEEIIGCV